MLDFRSVDRNNFRDILKLSVGEGQEHFVATNAYSLSQAKAQPECVPFAIYDGETLVGFCMYGMDVGDREYWIYRLMIDRAYQSQGYGREALSLLLERLQADSSHHMVYLSCNPETPGAGPCMKAWASSRTAGRSMGKSCTGKCGKGERRLKKRGTGG